MDPAREKNSPLFVAFRNGKNLNKTPLYIDLVLNIQDLLFPLGFDDDCNTAPLKGLEQSN